MYQSQMMAFNVNRLLLHAQGALSFGATEPIMCTFTLTQRLSRLTNHSASKINLAYSIG
ncbi:hypothetical protein FORC53_1487 [Vibrio vulnificus]|uniref:Uncharacterized protein n=1 Tax=Vibrio vulnificus TaxID=672 RepID=A0AAN1PP66_VIBVL|nr:hypothetical protein FORC53_1487 [Vibrio vulnificus]